MGCAEVRKFDVAVAGLTGNVTTLSVADEASWSEPSLVVALELVRSTPQDLAL